MKKMKYQNVKGTEDYLPEVEVERRCIRRTIEDVFIQYGCKPLETPILNYTDLLASKYAGGAEILEEMYTLSDRGERDLALRYDLTIPFAKVIAMNPTIRLPFKRYEIGKVFRDGPIKTGRYREFTQCDVDMVGVDSQIAEAECMTMATDIFDKLGLDVTIQYNNRKLLTGMLNVLGTPDEKVNRVILTLDKMEKVSIDAITEELREAGLPESTTSQIIQFITQDIDLSFFIQYENQSELIKEGLEEVKELESLLGYVGIDGRFNPFLARGLEIYTGIVYEIFLTDGSIRSSLGGGGRYDKAISGFVGGSDRFSTVGISFGLDVIYTALRDQKTDTQSFVDYYIIPVDKEKEALLIAKELRKQGASVEVEMGKKKIGKALDRANKEQARYAVIVGENEVANGEYRVKDMESGDEWTTPFTY